MLQARRVKTPVALNRQQTTTTTTRVTTEADGAPRASTSTVTARASVPPGRGSGRGPSRGSGRGRYPQTTARSQIASVEEDPSDEADDAHEEEDNVRDDYSEHSDDAYDDDEGAHYAESFAITRSGVQPDTTSAPPILRRSKRVQSAPRPPLDARPRKKKSPKPPVAFQTRSSGRPGYHKSRPSSRRSYRRYAVSKQVTRLCYNEGLCRKFFKDIEPTPSRVIHLRVPVVYWYYR
ncbi:hypothetical protein EXIGLDRAFT_302493 [Exidia glandulosa HHB12029]|uniref:Uncharacterized protein n=1 Tax=Exidia glandulosa HHB12029 TaxID=1314781 RepID=A0A165D6K7_EXIGL|nr:hypothetical protein EXIGLDRAFT_302493 [Exidia glandulosa HHB12029]